MAEAVIDALRALSAQPALRPRERRHLTIKQFPRQQSMPTEYHGIKSICQDALNNTLSVPHLSKSFY